MDRYYTADEVISIIKDGWKQSPERIRELIDFVESVKMTKHEIEKLRKEDDINLLYSTNEDYM